jgi:hypothetical protein
LLYLEWAPVDVFVESFEEKKNNEEMKVFCLDIIDNLF